MVKRKDSGDQNAKECTSGAVVILLIALALLPAQAEDAYLPAVINGAEGNAVIAFTANGYLSSGDILSIWSDDLGGLYFLGRIENTENIGLFHWKINDNSVTMVSVSQNENMTVNMDSKTSMLQLWAKALQNKYPKSSIDPVTLPGGLCAILDEIGARVAQQKKYRPTQANPVGAVL